MTVCGGHTAPKAPTEEVSAHVASVAAAIKEKIGNDSSELVLVSFTSQVVAGTMYMVKLSAGGDQHVHAKIFVPLPHTGAAPELKDAVGGKTAECELTPL
jgi:hypothetical protein|tara:strand:- start:387 stop:686 length:300 start_codon:yes stop_codon:yes gene_type:complete